MFFRTSTTIFLILMLLGIWWASSTLDPNGFQECRDAEEKQHAAQMSRAELKTKGLMDVLLTDIPKLSEQDRKAISDWEKLTSEAREMAFYCQRKLEGPRFFRTLFMVMAGVAGLATLIAFILRR